MIKSLYFSLVLLLLVSFSMNAQFHVKETLFRLPPNVVLKTKYPNIVDMAYKLQGSSVPEDIENIRNNYPQQYNLEALENYSKQLSLYNYLKEVKQYFNSLPQKVKQLYSTEELWYIYIYDLKLANHLLTL